MTDDERDILQHVIIEFGYHGGVGDPPNEDTILSIIRGTLEFIEPKEKSTGV